MATQRRWAQRLPWSDRSALSGTICVLDRQPKTRFGPRQGSLERPRLPREDGGSQREEQRTPFREVQSVVAGPDIPGEADGESPHSRARCNGTLPPGVVSCATLLLLRRNLPQPLLQCEVPRVSPRTPKTDQFGSMSYAVTSHPPSDLESRASAL